MIADIGDEAVVGIGDDDADIGVDVVGGIGDGNVVVLSPSIDERIGGDDGL